MAIGTITPVRGANFVSGNKRVRFFDVQLTAGANYTTGGETLTPSLLGLKTRIDFVEVGPARNAAGTAILGAAVNYVSAQSVKLQAYAASGSEQSANADLSTYTARVAVTGA